MSERSDVLRSDGYLPIEHYAAIGDGHALALVGIDGAIDWMCLPQLDSPSMFCALLDPEHGGRYVLAPSVPFTTQRRYLERTNILQTTFRTENGEVRVTDALTIDSAQRAPWGELVREVEGLSGTVPMRWHFEPRPQYGRVTPNVARRGESLLIRDGELQLALTAWDAGVPEVSAAGASSSFEMPAGGEAMLVMSSTYEDPLPLPRRAAVRRRLNETAGVWRAWVSRNSYDGPWRDAVERSLLAIKLLADARTGAIAAAGTTSLPEVLGGERNYDYRFGWVRDLCFTLDAVLAVGMRELTQDSVSWLLRATARTHPRVDPVYALGGDVVRSQDQLSLSGYRRTGPVHVGNKAGSQLQLGGFGDLIETISAYVSCGHVLSARAGERLADVGDLLTHLWQNEDSGLWELEDRAHYGTSKLGVWVAFERLLDLVACEQIPPRNLQRWRRARDEVRSFLERELFSEAKRSYLMKAGNGALDCGMLLAARRGFGERAKIEGTIDAIRGELDAGGPHLYRYSGMQDEENAFLACSYWMVEALASVGRLDEAAELMDAAVASGNDVGLFSEEMEPGSRTMRGNFPQALTHLSLIAAAHALSSADGAAPS